MRRIAVISIPVADQMRSKQLYFEDPDGNGWVLQETSPDA